MKIDVKKFLLSLIFTICSILSIQIQSFALTPLDIFEPYVDIVNGSDWGNAYNGNPELYAPQFTIYTNVNKFLFAGIQSTENECKASWGALDLFSVDNEQFDFIFEQIKEYNIVNKGRNKINYGVSFGGQTGVVF